MFEGLGPEDVVGGGEVEAGAGIGFSQGCGSLFECLHHHGIAEGGHTGIEDGSDEVDVVGRGARIDNISLDVVGDVDEGLAGEIVSATGKGAYVAYQGCVVGVCRWIEGCRVFACPIVHAEMTGMRGGFEAFGVVEEACHWVGGVAAEEFADDAPLRGAGEKLHLLLAAPVGTGLSCGMESDEPVTAEGR